MRIHGDPVLKMRGGTYRSYLKILHGVPVVFHKDDSVGTGEVEAEAAHAGGQQQHVNGGVGVEARHQAVPGRSGYRPVQAQVGHTRQVYLQQQPPILHQDLGTKEGAGKGCLAKTYR